MATISQFLEAAKSEVGYTESPWGSNRTKFAAAAGHADGQPWCLTFLVALANRVGLALPPGIGAYTPTAAKAFQWAGRIVRNDRIKPGDWVFFDFPDSTRRIQHVGVAVRTSGFLRWRTVTCVEGNTSPGKAGSQDNGGGVYIRTRPLDHVSFVGRPYYSQDDPLKEGDEMRYPDKGFETVTIGADGKGSKVIPVAFEDVTSVLVKANNNWTHPKARVLPALAQDGRSTILSAEGEPGQVGVVVGYRG